MTTTKLHSLLRKAAIPETLYNLTGSGRNDERFSQTEDSTENEQRWHVTFADSYGIQCIDEAFASETEACQFIYDEMSALGWINCPRGHE